MKSTKQVSERTGIPVRRLDYLARVYMEVRMVGRTRFWTEDQEREVLQIDASLGRFPERGVRA